MRWAIAEIEKKNMDTLQIIAVCEMMLMVVLSLALNLYWMGLMCKMARRSAARMSGEVDPQAKKTVEKVELID